MNPPNSTDPLDRLLERSPLPPAPPWFEQRLRARMLREAETPASPLRWIKALWSKPRTAITACGVLALLVSGLLLHTHLSSPPASPQLAQDDFNQAFETFLAYTEQAESWNLDW